MKFDYKINPELSVPIYKQLADLITAAVKKGEFEDKDRLPTVQEMADALSVARGTVKKAYDELEKTGILEKVQGRGTFIRCKNENGASRKERAMAAIDVMLDSLESLGFSVAEINIYLNLKLKERADRTDSVKIALFECNTENLSYISEQLRAFDNVEIYSYLLDSVRTNPYKIESGIDLAVTTQVHADEVESLLPDKTRVIRAALRLTPECLYSLVKLRAGQSVGMACYSERFAKLLSGTCKTYTEGIKLAPHYIFSHGGDLKKYLKGKNALLLPGKYEKYCTAADLETLRAFKGQIIVCTYEFDEGSMLYLKEKSKRIAESRKI